MPGILHKAEQPNWPDGPFTEGAMEEQQTSRADRGAWRSGITVILPHMPQASLKLLNLSFVFVSMFVGLR